MFALDCFKASEFRSEKPMGGPFDPPPPLAVRGLMLSSIAIIIITITIANDLKSFHFAISFFRNAHF